MTPKVLTISNFLSFAEPQTFVFPEAPGLYFMQGANVVEPRLGSNGAGKSSVWKALTWLLYGKTGEGLKAGDVCNWEVDRGVSVSLTFDDGNIITRTWKPNTFTRIDSDGEIHDLGKVDVVDILPIGMAAFMNSILIGQRQDMFLDAKPDQQAFLLGQVLELDKWIEFSQAASAMAGTLDFAIRKVELELARLGAFRDNRKDYSDLIAVWHSERSAKLAAVEKAYAEKLERSAKLKDEVDVLSKDEKTASGALNTARAQLTKSEDEFKASSSVMFAAIEAARDTLRDADAAKRQLEKVSREKTCPTCNRDLDARSHAKHVRDLEAQASNLLKWAKDHEVRVDDAESGHEIARRGLDADRESFDAFSAKVSKITDKLRTLRTTLQMLERELDDIEDSAAKLESEVNPYVALKEEDDREQVRVDNRIGVAQAELDGLTERKSLVTFWVKGFKEVRLASIAEALTEFEVEVNSCLIELGMVGWEVKFDVDRETKSGGIAKGFSVRVVSPTSDRPTPLAAWSGGEGQRLRVAATMGLSNLIRSRMGIDLPIEVWDEPSAGLSQQGMQDLLQALEYRAVREGRVIWIVDHTAHSYGGFAGGALISKSASGSSIEQF